MLVVVDANVVVQDPLLRDRKWDVAQEAVRAGRLRLVMPEVVRLEAIGGYRRDHEEKIATIRTVLRKSTTRAKSAAEALLRVYVDEIDMYEQILNLRICEIGFETQSPPRHSHIELTKRAIDRVAPFDKDGGGYRDTLVWLTALEQIGEAPFENLVLVSNDNDFLKQSKTLEAELFAETAGRLTILSSLYGVEFPGEYEGGVFNLSDSYVEEEEVRDAIMRDLVGLNITQWSPPGPDHAQISQVGRVDVGTITVKKRYGLDEYEIGAEAIADVDVAVLVVDGAEASQWAARWNVRVRWRGTSEDDGRRHSGLTGEFSLEVLGLEEGTRRPIRL